MFEKTLLGLMLMTLVASPAFAQNPPSPQPALTSQDLPPPMQGDIVPPAETGKAPPPPPPQQAGQNQAAVPPQQQQQAPPPQQAAQSTQGTYGASTYLRIGGQVLRFQMNSGLAADQKQRFQQLIGQSCFVDERAPALETPPCGLPIVWPKDQAGDGLAIYCDSGRDDCLSGNEAPRLRVAPAEPSRTTIAGNASAYTVQTRGATKKSMRPRVYHADGEPATASPQK